MAVEQWWIQDFSNVQEGNGPSKVWKGLFSCQNFVKLNETETNFSLFFWSKLGFMCPVVYNFHSLWNEMDLTNDQLLIVVVPQQNE